MAKLKSKKQELISFSEETEISVAACEILKKMISLDEEAVTKLLLTRVPVNKKVGQGGAVCHRDVDGYSMGFLALLNTVLKSTNNKLVVAVVEKGRIKEFEVDDANNFE